MTDEQLIQFFEQAWLDGNPLAFLFRTPSHSYLYDTGTNKIMACGNLAFELLGTLLEGEVKEGVATFIDRHGRDKFIKAANEIVPAIEEEHILKITKAANFHLSDHFQDVEEILSTHVQSINLEVTQSCNCRCLYCIYNEHVQGKRGHGTEVMSLETAKKAIDFLKKNSAGTSRVTIGFYGGEPLERFSFLRSCVDYAREVFSKVNFNMTTNGTLITPEIADYLLQEGVSVMVSIDGPEGIHNRYRQYNSGNGTFQDALRGLKRLALQHKKVKKGSIAINAVYAPPFSAAKLETIYRYFNDLEWFQNANILINYASDGTLPENLVTGEELKQDKSMNQWAFEKYQDSFSDSKPMIKNLVEKRLAGIIQRYVLKEPCDRVYLNGCCLPGQRKSFITTDGTIHVCEKLTTNAPPLGHVDRGFDIPALKRFYIDEYAQKSLPDCQGCWAIRLCDICYTSAINNEGRIDIVKKRKYCQSMRWKQAETLSRFAAYMEEKPGAVEYLYNYEIV